MFRGTDRERSRRRRWKFKGNEEGRKETGRELRGRQEEEKKKKRRWKTRLEERAKKGDVAIDE